MSCFKKVFLSGVFTLLLGLPAGAVVYSFEFNPKCALTANYSQKDSSGMIVNGEAGVSLFGNTDSNISFTGLACGFLMEDFQKKHLYGINTGICGNWKEVYGAELSLSNKNRIVAGLQFGLLGNLADTVYGLQLAGLHNSLSEGAGLQIAFGNEQRESETKDKAKKTECDFVQMGIVNSTATGVPLQIGILNMSMGRGLQIGLINYSKKNFLPFFPIFNF